MSRETYIPPTAGSFGDLRQQWAILSWSGSIWRPAWDRSGRPCVYPTRAKARMAKANAEMAASAKKRQIVLRITKIYQVLLPISGALEGIAGYPRERANVRDLLVMLEPQS